MENLLSWPLSWEETHFGKVSTLILRADFHQESYFGDELCPKIASIILSRLERSGARVLHELIQFFDNWLRNFEP